MSVNKLLKSGVVFTLGNLLLKGVSFITMPIYTRIISKEVFGEYNLYNSWISLISLFIGLQLSGSFAVAKIKYEKKYDEYAVNILTTSNLLFVLIMVVVYSLKDLLSHLLEFNSYYVIIMFINSYLGYLVGFIGNYFIQRQKTTMTLLISVFTTIFSVVLSIALIFTIEDDFFARVLGGFVPALLGSFYVLYYFYRKKSIVYKKEYLYYGLSISIPLIFHHLGHNILNQFDRIMIGKMMTLEDVALYSFGYNLALVLQIVLNSINTSWVPWYFEERKNNSVMLPYYIKRYTSLGLFLTLGYLTIFPELVVVMGGDLYKDSMGIVSLIIVSYFFAFLYAFPVNIQFFYENTKLIPIGTIIAGIINIVLNFILIPILGIYGAALATIISYIFLLIIHHIVSKIKYNYDDVSAKQYTILSVIAIIYSFVMNYFVEYLLIRWSLGLVVLLIFVYYYKSDLVTIVKNNKIIK